MKLLCDYDWHGNVIELKNTIEKAVTVAKSETLKSENLPANIRSRTSQSDTDQSLDTFEKKYIGKILNENNWNISRSSEKLNIDRATLYNKIKKYNLSENS
ncbi:helix-turn-helix domain-containing protein [Bacteroidota bacterium]